MELTSIAAKKSASQKYQRLALWSSVLLGGFTLLMAGSGIYSVLNYQHTLSRPQMGMHLLLGASTTTFTVQLGQRMGHLLMLAHGILFVIIGLFLILSSPEMLSIAEKFNKLILQGFMLSSVLVALVVLVSAWHTTRALISSWPMQNLKRG